MDDNFIMVLKREAENKEKKQKLLQHGIFVFVDPFKNPTVYRRNFVKWTGRDAILVVR